MTRARALWAVALTAIAVAYALPMGSVGCAQTSHYAATRSFAEGHPDIDRYAEETCDLVRTNGHFYAAKGTAMDWWTAPWYLLLRSAGAVPANPNHGMGYPAAMLGVPLRALWQIGLWAVVLPALLLLELVRRTVERIEPGLGVPAAVVLGLGTLVLPFSTMLFAHVPAAMFAFLSFALLLRGERGLAAGLAAGLACATDIPLAVPAVLLGLYAATSWRRLAAFGAGGIVGLVPLLGFNWWAFGNPFHLSYSGTALNPGANGVEQSQHVAKGFFYQQLPDFRVAVELLLSPRGLLVLTPVVAAGIAGIVFLWRRGLRREAALIAALCVVEVTWVSGRQDYTMALGGWVPGPRFLIPLLPFLAFALAPVLRRAAASVWTLALVSAGAMTVATSAEPLLQNDDTHHWISRIADGNFTATVVSLAGVGHGWIAIVPFFLAVLLALGAGIAATPLGGFRLVPVVLVAWVVVEHGAPALLQVDRLVRESYGLLAALALVSGVAWALVRLHRGELVAAAPAVLLLAFGLRRFDEHTKWALLLGVLVLLGLGLAGRLRTRVIPA